MTTYYVATLGNYVLVDAINETDACEQGSAALRELTGAPTPNIRTIRPATGDEIEFWRWHHERVAREPGGPTFAAGPRFVFGRSGETSS